MSHTTLNSHALAGSYNSGAYTATVEREDRGYSFGRRQYAYYARITRKSDGKQVRVVLQTLRNGKHFGDKTFSTWRFEEWLKTSKVHTPVVTKEVASKKADIIAIDTDYTKTAKVTINIQKTFEGDAEDVRDELYNLISELEDAIREIED